MPAVEQDLTQGSVTRKLVRYALPLVASSLLQAIYSITDIIIAGHYIGDVGISAINNASIIMNMLTQLAIGLTVGGNVLVGQYFGSGDHENRRKSAGNMLTVGLIAGLLFAAGILLLGRPLLILLQSPTLEEATAYLSICGVGLLFIFVYNSLSAILRGVGNSRIPLYCIIASVSLNVVLDILFVAGFHMGVAGAALATVISQGISAAWVLKFLTGRRALLTLKLSCLPLQARRVKRIVALGLSGFFMNMTNSLVQIVCNATLQSYGGDLYVGVMTIITSLREVFFMPVHGLSNGSQPVMGFNYGAGLYSRVRKSIRFSCGLTVAYAAAFWAAAMLLPELMIRVFNSEPEVIAAGVSALRVYFALFIPMSLQSAGQSVFVALGRSKQAVFFSLLRKAIINAPLTVILPIWMDTMGVFYAEAASQLVGGLACFATMYFTLYRPLGRLKDGEKLPGQL